MTEIPIYLELGKKRVFACSPDWPGWCRSAKDEEGAVAALLAYAPRYAVVPAGAGMPFPHDGLRVTVKERVAGSVTTDFGAPDRPLEADWAPLPPEEADRLCALLAECWRFFDRTVARAPAELRKGPRGGGRDTHRVVEHVIGAETGYMRVLGVREKVRADDPEGLARFREAVLAAIRASSPEPAVKARWPVRYAVRRAAWHVLDHAWEVEDRGDLEPETAGS